MTSEPILGYWSIRGLAQPIRLLLEYTTTKFEDKHYECGPAPDFDKSCWFGVKEQLGLDFPNLPYYMDGDIKITQSNAIMRHIARKNNLCGTTEKEQIAVDMIENEAMDFRNGFVRLCYINFAGMKDQYLKSLSGKIKQFADFLGDKKWFAGDNLTFVDFLMYEMFDEHLFLAPDCLKATPNLVSFHTRFEALEPIKAYMNSSRFMKTPLNNKMAKFGNE